MHLRRISDVEIPIVYTLLARNGWQERIGSVAEFACLVASSQVADVAVSEKGAIIGFARALTDGRSNGYLSMLVVAAEHRRQGVGRALVENLIGARSEVTWVLRAGRAGSAEFFAKLGFEPSVVAMERRRELPPV